MENPQLTKEQFIRTYRSNIGLEIRRYRIKKGFNQANLADFMDISRRTISKIENGKFAISIDSLAKFAWHLDFAINIKLEQ
jgi:transcriptional regulator with XRE-family HTH domain